MSVLRNRSFSILLSGQLISMFGSNVFALALPWYVYLSTNSKLALATVGFVQSLPNLAGLFAGVFVDRFKKRKTMVVVDLLRFGISLFIGLIAYLKFPFPWIVLSVLLLQLAGVFFGPAVTVLIPLVVGDEQVPAAMGMNQSGGALAQLAGQMGGGALLVALGAPLLFIANGISFLVSVISLLFVRADEPPRVVTSSSFFQEWREGLQWIGRSKMMILILSASIVTNFGMAPFDIAMTAWVRGPLHASAFWLGLIGAAFFVGIIVGGFLLGAVTKRVPLRTTLMLGLMIAGLTISAVGAFLSTYWAMGLLLICGLSVGILNGSLGALLVRVVIPEMRGRVFGLVGALATIATPLGLAVFGGIMVLVSLAHLFIMMGGLCFLGGGVTMLLPIRDDLSKDALSARSLTS